MEALRTRYQKSLLAWLKTADDTGSTAPLAALAGMRETLRAIAETLPERQEIALAGERLFAAIAEGRLPPALEYRRLAGRIEQTLRAGQSAEKNQETLDGLLAALPPEPAPESASEPAPETPPHQATLPAAATPEKKDPLAATLEAATDLLPLLGEKSKEPRFTLQQRALWDAAVEAFALAWEHCRRDLAAAATADHADEHPVDWSPLRKAIFRLLEGALPLEHPAPLHLAEALASSIDELDVAAPTPRLFTALTACLELLQEKDFLEHEALENRVTQLVERLERRNENIRSRTVDQLFAHEAMEELEQMRVALDNLPPDTESIADSAKHLQQLAEPLELFALASAASRFSGLVATLDPACLDGPPGRDEAFAWIADMEAWVAQIGEGDTPSASDSIDALQARLEEIGQTRTQ
ncbi:MAG: hypothetical protein LBI31_07305 [Zoogloeaceae bacterium]|jgi:hypothetical protein|nr:hypothetical protein [Zoogloeaceae bacterium]